MIGQENKINNIKNNLSIEVGDTEEIMGQEADYIEKTTYEI